MVNFEEYSNDEVGSLTSADQLYTTDDTHIVKDEPQPARTLHPQPWCGQHLANGDNGSKNVYNYCNQEEKEKTPMCRIAELARFNKLKHEYQLLDESGPAHKKLFTVQLVLSSDQVFEGSGASIKKAQQAAASEALERTSFGTPPDKNSTKKKKADPSSPVHLLSQMTRRLNLPDPMYRPHTPSNFKMPRTRLQNGFVPMLQGPPSVPHGMYPRMVGRDGVQSSGPVLPPPINMQPFPRNMASSIMGPPAMMPTGNPFMSIGALPVPPPPHNFPPFDSAERTCAVSVALGPTKVFTGFSSNFSQAKMNAAAQALLFLGPAIQQLDVQMKEEERQKKKIVELSTDMVKMKLNVSGEDHCDNEDDIPKHRQKSVISQVHECALQMKLNVEFEVLMEDGPPHERSYMVKCSMRNTNNVVVIEETGAGRKKKEATQEACCNVLSRLRGVETSPIYIASSLLKTQKKIAAQPKDPKRKTIVKDMKMDPSYGHQINPVSRLIQIVQARGDVDPVFNLVGEHGQSRYKEFIVEVTSGDRTCSGSGPNKRLAKRAAAEAMLSEIGFVKPLPAPGKSLLKRKEPQMSIGIFDPNDLGPPPVLAETTADVFGETMPRHDSSVSLKWDVSVDATSPPTSEPSSGHASPTELNEVPPSPSAKRRVTFSNQVKACPPPEDANYPQPEVAPLKADVVVEGRLKRIRKSKEGKRALTDEQKAEISTACKMFVHEFCSTRTNGNGEASDTELQDSSKRKLDEISELYKFSVQYTNFPKSPDVSDQLYFALVSLGLDKPMVLHGSGVTVDAAADNAAYNAICSLANPKASPGAVNVA